MGDDASRHCYTEAIEVDAHEHQPRIGELVNVPLVVRGQGTIMARTRVRTRKVGPIVREPGGTRLNLINRPYEKAFGCL
jgi:ribosome assembly protein YihI (activator of Der GTPase)